MDKWKKVIASRKQEGAHINLILVIRQQKKIELQTKK